ncbi:MAG: efflux RND transporter periplasmic adaptor subunit [Desulfobacteraceae bacterium]|nr:efflux RND transporter periplasmic adaptor subunit [Desulfobacteraceae bacterium]
MQRYTEILAKETQGIFMRVVLTLTTLLYFLLWLGCGDEKSKNNPRSGNPAEQVKLVKVSSVKAGPLQSSVEYVGALSANLKVKVATEIGGSIEQLFFERGARVKEDQLLAEVGTSSILIEVEQAEAALGVTRSRLKKTERGSRPEEIRIAKARVEEAQAGLREAERNFERIDGLYGDKAVSDSDYDAAKRAVDIARANLESARQQLELAKQGPRIEEREEARAALKQAQAALSMAKDRLKKSRLHAPSEGIIAFRQVEEGEVVAPGTVITQVVDNRKMKIKLSLAERDLPLLDRDERFPFTIDAYPGAEFTCRLNFLSPTADPATRSFPVELLVDATDPRMADGMTVRVEFPMASQKKSIKIPSAWLSEEDGQIGLFVVADEKALFKKVTLGSYYEGRVEILSGISDDELVITNPAGLKAGEAVTY